MPMWGGGAKEYYRMVLSDDLILASCILAARFHHQSGFFLDFSIPNKGEPGATTRLKLA